MRKNIVEIDAHEPAPVLEGFLFGRSTDPDAGVIHQHIEPSELRELDELLRGAVPSEGEAIAPAVAELTTAAPADAYA